MNNENTRSCQYVKKITLKDGSVKECTYTKQYDVKTPTIKCGKTKMMQKIKNCNDKQKLELLKELMDDIGM